MRINRRKLLLLACTLLILHGAYGWWHERPLSRGPGVLVTDPPRQVLLPDSEPFTHQGHTLKPLAEYRIQARVIGKEYYHFDATADFAPLDLALGWGPLSDEAVLEHIDFRQSSRWLTYRYRQAPVTPQVITTHTANVHAIPADDAVERALERLRPGHVVDLAGYLVQVHLPGGLWVSSLSREDDGNGACEIMWIREIAFR
jgi:hypothetical protein